MVLKSACDIFQEVDGYGACALTLVIHGIRGAPLPRVLPSRKRLVPLPVKRHSRPTFFCGGV